MLFTLVFFCIVLGALLVNLLVLVLENTLVKGLFDILFGRTCFLVDTCLVTFVLAGSSAVLGCHLSVPSLWPSSCYDLWLVSTRSSHCLSCWFVASSLISNGLLKILSSPSGSPISLNVYRCVTFFVSASYSATTIPPINVVPVFPYLFYKWDYGLEEWMKCFYFVFLFTFVLTFVLFLIPFLLPQFSCMECWIPQGLFLLT